MYKILVVCLGNICRSPLAEGILKNYLPEEHFFIDSAGTGDYHIGDPPDRRSIQIAKQNNIDISTQKARQFTKEDFSKFNLIYVMDKSNYQNVLKLSTNKEDSKKVKLILGDKEVPDPYHGDLNDFEYVYNLLDKDIKKISQKLVTEFDI